LFDFVNYCDKLQLMSLIQEAARRLIGSSVGPLTDVPEEININLAELKSIRLSGLLAGVADALHGQEFNLPNSKGGAVSWLEERSAYIKGYFATQWELDKKV